MLILFQDEHVFYRRLPWSRTSPALFFYKQDAPAERKKHPQNIKAVSPFLFTQYCHNRIAPEEHPVCSTFQIEVSAPEEPPVKSCIDENIGISQRIDFDSLFIKAAIPLVVSVWSIILFNKACCGIYGTSASSGSCTIVIPRFNLPSQGLLPHQH